MLEHTLKSKNARSVLREYANEFDVYIEDESIVTQKIYVDCINRVLGRRALKSVNGLGGRKQVKTACSSHQGHRISFYIIDRDFDRLRGMNIVRSGLLNQLSRYSIENYAVCDIAMREVLADRCMHMNEDEIRQISMNSEIKRLYEQINRLIALFVVAHDRISDVKTCSQKLYGYWDRDSNCICKYRLISKFRIVFRELRKKLSLSELKAEIEGVISRMHIDKAQIDIPGKTFIIPLVKINMNNSSQINDEELLWNLYRHRQDNALELEMKEILESQLTIV